MSNKRIAQGNILTRRRIRARLLLAGVTVGDVAALADVDASFVSHVFAGNRSATSEAGRRVVAAAESLSGTTWGKLSAPLPVRRPAAPAVRPAA